MNKMRFLKNIEKIQRFKNTIEKNKQTFYAKIFFSLLKK